MVSSPRKSSVPELLRMPEEVSPYWAKLRVPRPSTSIVPALSAVTFSR